MCIRDSAKSALDVAKADLASKQQAAAGAAAAVRQKQVAACLLYTSRCV